MEVELDNFRWGDFIFTLTKQTSAFDSLLQNELLLHFWKDTKQRQDLIYTWQTPPTVILGAKDTRLPQLQKGISYLNNHKYAIVVRTSGGLAVVSDPNICNISMFTTEELTIDSGYEKMITFLQQIIPNTKLIAKEVSASYCPGKFDICINNQKIAGLSQKRLGQTTVIMAYISLSGNQSDRCTLIKEFYQLSKADNTYPKIKNKSMTTLHDLNIDTYHISELKKSNANINKQFNKWLLSNKQLKQQIKITLQNRQIGR